MARVLRRKFRMATKLPKTDVVIIGVGWAGGIIASELTKQGKNVVGLERGKGRKLEDYFMMHDELRLWNSTWYDAKSFKRNDYVP